MTPVAPILDPTFVAAFPSGTLTPDQADAILPRDRAAVIFFLLQLSLTAGSPAPASGAHTPSGTVPPYAKPSATPRRKKRGAVPGHPGATRPRPERIDRHESHQLLACPDCGGELTRTGRTRTRLVEDIPDDLRPEVTEHTIHRDWCPCCQRQVEPLVFADPCWKAGFRQAARDRGETFTIDLTADGYLAILKVPARPITSHQFV